MLLDIKIINRNGFENVIIRWCDNKNKEIKKNQMKLIDNYWQCTIEVYSSNIFYNFYINNGFGIVDPNNSEYLLIDGILYSNLDINKPIILDKNISNIKEFFLCNSYTSNFKPINAKKIFYKSEKNLYYLIKTSKLKSNTVITFLIYNSKDILYYTESLIMLEIANKENDDCAFSAKSINFLFGYLPPDSYKAQIYIGESLISSNYNFEIKQLSTYTQNNLNNNTSMNNYICEYKI